MATAIEPAQLSIAADYDNGQRKWSDGPSAIPAALWRRAFGVHREHTCLQLT
jgi:hypothetical protein